MDAQADHTTLHGKFKQIVLLTNGVLLFLGILVNFADIICRNLLDTSLPWAHKVTVWLVILACYLAIGPQLKDVTHIRVEFVYEKFKGVPKNVIDLISNICILAFSIIAIISGIFLVMHAYSGEFTETMGSWHFPIWVTYFVCFCIGVFIMVIYSFHLFLFSIKAMCKKTSG
ncbi:MAG: TRAP transporter small permease [Deltaproteobacteria bacterium]|nr:TRAP transporter small permease [Deltaproteobacteria bacterium]